MGMALVACLIVGAGAGAVLSRRAANLRVVNTLADQGHPRPNTSESFWKRVPPSEWKAALSDDRARSGVSAFSSNEAPVLIAHLDLLRELMVDKSIGQGTRFELTSIVYGLAVMQIVVPRRPLSELDEDEAAIMKAAIFALKERHDIALSINPIDALGAVWLAVGLLSPQGDAPTAHRAILEYGWELPETTVADAISAARSP